MSVRRTLVIRWCAFCPVLIWFMSVRDWSTEAASEQLPDMQRMKLTTTGHQTDRKRIKRSSVGYEMMMYEIKAIMSTFRKKIDDYLDMMSILFFLLSSERTTWNLFCLFV